MKLKLPDLSKFRYTHTTEANALTPFGWAVGFLTFGFTAFSYQRDAGGVLFTLGSALFTLMGFHDLRKVFHQQQPPVPEPTIQVSNITNAAEASQYIGVHFKEVLPPPPQVNWPLPSDEPVPEESVKVVEHPTVIIPPVREPEPPKVDPADTGSIDPLSATSFIINYPED